MSLSKLVLSFGVLALGIAAAASSYRITLSQLSVLGTTELKPGDYRLQVDGDQATISSGKYSANAPVKVETGSEKYSSTVVRYARDDGRNHILEIRLGGTRTKLIFSN